MKNIKFRAWDVEANKMWYNGVGGIFEGKVFIGSEGYLKDGSVLMPATGKLDINGDDIYESDIISVSEVDSSQPSVGKPRITQKFDKAVVTWNNILLCYMYNPLKHPKWQLNPHQMLGYGYGIEVIGNIYENPELLFK